MLDFTLLFIFFLEIIDHFYHRYLQSNMRFIIWKFMYINILFSVCEKIRISNFLLIFIHWNTFNNI